LAAFDDLELESLVTFLLLLDGDLCVSEYVSLDPWGVELFLNEFNYIFHLVSDSGLLLSEAIEFGLSLGDLFSTLVEFNPSGIRILIKNIEHTDQDIPSQILIGLDIVHWEIPLIIT
jgi:hypothetical protein